MLDEMAKFVEGQDLELDHTNSFQDDEKLERMKKMKRQEIERE